MVNKNTKNISKTLNNTFFFSIDKNLSSVVNNVDSGCFSVNYCLDSW